MVADVGARIRSLRTAKGLTQAQLAEPNYTKAYIPLLEQLEDGLTARDQLVRLRYLGAAHNVAGHPKQAFPVVERAQRMAELLADREEEVRVKAVLAACYERTY